jgi:hypothetical protein
MTMLIIALRFIDGLDICADKVHLSTIDYPLTKTPLSAHAQVLTGRDAPIATPDCSTGGRPGGGGALGRTLIKPLGY